MATELAKEDRDVKAVWQRLKETELQITEWRGPSAFVAALTGPGAADYIQIALGREIEWRAGPIVNPNYRPFGEEELLDPSWPRSAQLPPGRYGLTSAADGRHHLSRAGLRPRNPARAAAPGRMRRRPSNAGWRTGICCTAGKGRRDRSTRPVFARPRQRKSKRAVTRDVLDRLLSTCRSGPSRR